MSTFGREQRIYADHVFSMLRAGRIGAIHEADQNSAGDLQGWESADRKLLIEEGRRQLDRQTADLERVRTRGQVVFAVGIALVGAIVSLVGDVEAIGGVTLWSIWTAAVLIGAWATLGSAAVATVTAQNEAIHASVLSRKHPPVEKSLARDYAICVVAGENAVATRLTNFRWAVSFLLVSAALAGCAFGWTRLGGPSTAQNRTATPPTTPTTTTTTTKRSIPTPPSAP